MVSIPVRLYKAARRERIRFHHVYRPARATGPSMAEVEEDFSQPEAPPDTAGVRELPKAAVAASPPTEPPSEPLARVRNVPVGEAHEEPIEKQQILKAYEIEKDRYVALEPREIAALRPHTSTELEIAGFVHLEEIDPIYFETSYYVAPDTGGEKGYALLFRALSETGYAATGSLVMHGREHATAIRPGRHGLILHTLFYANEVREAEEYRGDPAQVAPKELDLAKLFIRTLATHFDPAALKDTFEQRLHELIAARSEAAVEAYTQGKVTKRAPVVDILEALRKSLEMARKPASSEKAVRRPGPSRRRRS